MIIGRKTTGWPVAGVNFGGRQVYLQVNPGDKEEQLNKFGAIICVALKMFADVSAAPETNHHRIEVVKRWLKIWESTGIDMSHTVETNIKPLRNTEIDDG
jgi:hypothetical protein